MGEKFVYQWGNAFFLERKDYAFVFGIQEMIQAIGAHKTGELDDKSRSFENVIQTARKNDEASPARLIIPKVFGETIYSGPHHNNDDAFIVDRKSQNQVYRGSPNRVVSSP